jgi:signal transduction histidine kinase/DNA-binding response OmpR family regulator
MPENDKVNVLVVDDMPEKLLVYKSILEELGQNLITAGSGAEALKLVLQRDFAVILLDVNMPGMDGFEAATLIRGRKRSAHTPIIFITSFHDEVHTAQGYAHGGVDYIPAPVVPEILRAKVKVFVELFRMRRQVERQAEEEAQRLAAEESARRFAFLAGASSILASSLASEALLPGLARLAVPFLADLAVVCPATEQGRPLRTEWAWTAPAPDSVAQPEDQERPALAPWLQTAVGRVLKTGKLELQSRVNPPAPAAEPPGPESEGDGSPPPARPGFPVESLMVLPLAARGRILGAIALAMGPSARRYHSADVQLAEDLAGRATIAYDNSLLLRKVLEADQRKTEFLSMLAHELRNPLAPIRNGIQVLRMLEPKEPILAQVSEMIDRQTKHMTRLVDDLLDISRITSGKIRLQRVPMEAARVVESALETARPLLDARRHAFTLSMPPQPVWVNGDPDRLAQVLANLLNNAAKYTREGGRVDLCMEQEDQEVVFRVRDNGIGIEPEMLSRVFDLFTQVDCSLDRSQGGLGIGLTLVRSLVEMHQGRVEALSRGPGQGSEFVVRLPALKETIAAPPEGRIGHAECLEKGPCRVLVVDDNVDAAESLAILLRLSGHEVRMARDGPEALAAAAGFSPHMVLLDIGLPGMDGYEVARRLRSGPATGEAVLVALTGYGEEEHRRKSREAGFDRHVIKPVDPQTLKGLLHRAGAPPGNLASQSR